MLFSAAKGYNILIGICYQHFLLRLALFVICYSMAVLGSVLCYRGVLAGFLGLFLHFTFPAIETPFLAVSDRFFYGIPSPNVFFTLPLSPYFYLITRNPITWDVLSLYTGVAVGLMVLSFNEDDTFSHLPPLQWESLFRAMEQDALEGNDPLTAATTPYEISFAQRSGSYLIGPRLYISENATHTIALCQELLSSQ